MGLAILWVMLFHAYPFTFEFQLLDSVKEIGFAGVDVFILLSSMGLYVSLQRNQKITLPAFYLRRGQRVLPAYWLVVGTYSLALVLIGRIRVSTALWSISTLHYWFHIPGAFNWYIPALLAFYLITPGYVRVFDRCPRKGLLTAAMFPAAYGLYRLSILMRLNYTEDFVNRIPAFALGIFVGYSLQENRSMSRRQAAVWGTGCLIGLVVTLLWLKRKLYVSPCYLIAAFLVPGCLLAAWAILHLHPRIKAILGVLGENSLEIYLINVVITREYWTLAPYLDRGPRHVVYYLLVYTANLLAAFILHRILKALPRRAGGTR